MALEASGWDCAFANDIDDNKWEMYSANFPGAERHFVLGDIRAIKAEEITSVDLATPSFPGPALGLAGARAGLAGEHSSALWPFLEVLEKIRSMRPPLVMLENVPGFLTSHGGADFRSALVEIGR